MTARLAHRGPDDSGIYVRGPVGFGHRRLSIIDLEGGQQPMLSESGEIAVTYNGELYNFRQLKEELSASGHQFRTSSDTEVIVHAWEEWGQDCVQRFRGMFAVAIADWRRRELFLARDHLGIKPLVYWHQRGQFAFASELQALRNLPHWSGEINLRSLDAYLRFGYVPAPLTIYRGIWKLPPAHRLLISFDGETRGPERYWQLRYRPESGVSGEEWSRRLEEVLRESVRSHLVADVPFGAFLSGGLDSTAVVGLMARELEQPIRTFSIGFDDQDFCELEYARQVARRYKTEHHEEIVRPDALGVLPDLVQHYGEPFGDSSAIPTYYVSQMARRHVPMVLSGDGGDEALAGYGRYAGWKRYLQPHFPQRPAWKRLLRSMGRAMLPHSLPVDGQVASATSQVWAEWVQSVPTALSRQLWRQEHHSRIEPAWDPFEFCPLPENGCPPESVAQYLDYHTYLPQDILTKVDIASMMHGLEVRTPIVDWQVAEFCATIPFDTCLELTPNGGWSGKQPLKRMVREEFGDEFINRPKTGFGVPLKHWFNECGDLRNVLEDRLLRPQAAIGEYFNQDVIRRMVQQMDQRDLSQPLWQLLFLDYWLDADSSSQRTLPVKNGATCLR